MIEVRRDSEGFGVWPIGPIGVPVQKKLHVFLDLSMIYPWKKHQKKIKLHILINQTFQPQKWMTRKSRGVAFCTLRQGLQGAVSGLGDPNSPEKWGARTGTTENPWGGTLAHYRHGRTSGEDSWCFSGSCWCQEKNSSDCSFLVRLMCSLLNTETILGRSMPYCGPLAIWRPQTWILPSQLHFCCIQQVRQKRQDSRFRPAAPQFLQGGCFFHHSAPPWDGFN